MGIELSVVTPAFNAARHLPGCIANVAAQGLGARVEHIVMDGGSADGTRDVLTEASARHPHLVWRSEADRGQGDAMNKATALARGAIIGVLNADDEYLAGTLAFVLEVFRDLPTPAILIGDCEVADERGRLLFMNRPKARSAFGLAIGLSHPSNPAAYFYHRALHDRVGGYDVDDHYSLDIDFLYRALPMASVRYVNRSLGRFNLLPECKTRQDAELGPSRVASLQRRYSHGLPLHQRLIAPLARTALASARRLRDAVR